MRRVLEPEVMDDPDQAKAYAGADFAEPNARFIALFVTTFGQGFDGCALDLGCGPGDVTLRFARAFPRCNIHGVDGARAMLGHANDLLRSAPDLQGRVEFIHGLLPGAKLPRRSYDAVICNSLLHHLADPDVLWESVKRLAAPGSPVLVGDLRRPRSAAQARRVVETYAATEPEVLQRDFQNSLLAAFEPREVTEQLDRAGLGHFAVAPVGDRHMIVSGTMRS